MTIIPQCFGCQRLQPGKPMRCQAFPGGIPDPILYNEADHTRPYPGDHGLRFEAKPDDQGKPS